MRCGFVIPVYNHGATLQGVVSSIERHGLPILVVDDGNDGQNRAQIAAVAARHSLVTLVTRQKNGGKGAAMKSGIRAAQGMGLTHMLQLDSDGQHDAGRVARFLELSRQNPAAVICGYPQYDADAPAGRRKGRKVANAWAHVVTLSGSIQDAMIGFRVYPVQPFVDLLDRHAIIDNRMGFDIDILVRLSWRGVPIISEPVKVSYPADGISNFRMVRDNARIALVYARLCLGMIVRLPVLLARKVRGGGI